MSGVDRANLLRFDMTEDIGRHPQWLDVSPQTSANLEKFLDLVIKWNATINLISNASVRQAWLRHILDSAQLWPIASVTEGTWLDIGSGGGFPGLVIALMAQELAPEMRVVLVESDRRKAVFLKEAIRQLDVAVDVRCGRIENLPALGASVISARALAPLSELLPLAFPHLAPDGIIVLPKGQGYRAELEKCQIDWKIKPETIPSKTSDDGVILRIRSRHHG